MHRRGDRRAHERRLAWYDPHGRRTGDLWRSCRGSNAGGGNGTYTLLELGGALWSTPGPLAQTLDLACLRERE